ncbi:MAG: hypothetical protein ACOYOU_11715 [Kiritimatiellia bacterium]
MPIIQASDTSIRADLRRYLETRRSQNPDFRILEVGAAANPQYDDLVDTYMDLFPVRSQKPTITGDINLPEVWDSMSGKSWDFVICSHVLEDIRDPLFVLRQLTRHARGGFIAVPNKHTELSKVESWLYVGYAHHRWIFTVQHDVLRILAKWPIANYFARVAAPARWLGRLPGAERIQIHLGMAPGGPGLAWLDHCKVRSRKHGREGLELGVLWEHDLSFEYVNADYAGHDEKPSYMGQILLYHRELREGL